MFLSSLSACSLTPLFLLAMITVSLFLGFRIEKDLETQLKKNDENKLALFISNDGDHLRQVIYKGQQFLGKFTGQPNDVESLALLEANIYSLLKMLVPDYDFAHSPLILFPIEIE